MNNLCSKKFSLRLRFKVKSTFEIEAEQYAFLISNREVILKGAHGALISGSKWLTLTSRGFDTTSDAIVFGSALKQALEICSITNRFGVDTGKKGNDVSIIDSTGYCNEVHGLLVHPESDNIRFFWGSGSITQRFMAAPFFSDVAKCAQGRVQVSIATENIILLLNTALMQEDPVSRIVFSISAVEMLAQNETWSKNQRNMLSALSIHAMSLEDSGSIDERSEIADAIKRSIHRVGLRQGVLRLLNSLGLSNLKKEWDEVYDLRSKLFHGLQPQSMVSHEGLAQRALHLCGNILLTAIAKEIPDVEQKISNYRILRRNQ